MVLYMYNMFNVCTLYMYTSVDYSLTFISFLQLRELTRLVVVGIQYTILTLFAVAVNHLLHSV